MLVCAGFDFKGVDYTSIWLTFCRPFIAEGKRYENGFFRPDKILYRSGYGGI